MVIDADMRKVLYKYIKNILFYTGYPKKSNDQVASFLNNCNPPFSVHVLIQHKIPNIVHYFYLMEYALLPRCFLFTENLVKNSIFEKWLKPTVNLIALSYIFLKVKDRRNKKIPYLIFFNATPCILFFFLDAKFKKLTFLYLKC